MTNEQKWLSQVCSLLLKIALETFSLCSTPSGQGNRAIFCLLHLWGINSPPETCSTQSWIYSALLQEEDSRAHLPSQCIGLKSENEHTHTNDWFEIKNIKSHFTFVLQYIWITSDGPRSTLNDLLIGLAWRACWKEKLTWCFDRKELGVYNKYVL